MPELDLNDVAALEKAIANKYGPEAVINPKSLWDEEKEKNYRLQLKELSKIRKKTKQFSIVEVNNAGTLIKTENRSCPCCHNYSFDSRDDFYVTRFECCRECYFKYVDGREQRWKDGWRPG
jgi:hypothetical protein